MVAPFASETPGVSGITPLGRQRPHLERRYPARHHLPLRPPPHQPGYLLIPRSHTNARARSRRRRRPAPGCDDGGRRRRPGSCWNAGDWNAVAAIVTPRFLQTALGIDAPDVRSAARAVATLDPGPLHIETIGPVGIWSDGRGAVDVLYLRGRGNPVQAVAARWFLVAERGVVRFDEEVLLLPPPLGDRVTIGFAIADDQQPLQWSNPTGGEILRLAGDRAARREPGPGVTYVSIGRNRWRNARRSHAPSLAPGRPRAARSPGWNLSPARPGGAWIRAVFEGDRVMGDDDTPITHHLFRPVQCALDGGNGAADVNARHMRRGHHVQRGAIPR